MLLAEGGKPCWERAGAGRLLLRVHVVGAGRLSGSCYSVSVAAVAAVAVACFQYEAQQTGCQL